MFKCYSVNTVENAFSVGCNFLTRSGYSSIVYENNCRIQKRGILEIRHSNLDFMYTVWLHPVKCIDSLNIGLLKHACTFSVTFQTRACPWRGPCESKQTCREHHCMRNLFHNKCIKRKCLTLKVKDKVTDNNIHHGIIRWRMSNSIKITPEHFSLALTVFEIFIFENSWPWKCKSRSWRTGFAVAPFDGKYLTFNLTAIVMFALSLTVYEIFANKRQLKKKKKTKRWSCKWRSKSKKVGIYAIQLEMLDSI